jgi:transposase InsO family protein
MDKGRFLIETHLRTDRPIAELAATHGVHRSWLYKLLARYRLEGDAGLEPRSKRPHSSPTRIADVWEEEIVALRKELGDAGLDAGAQTIHVHLSRRHQDVPSVPTIWRVLKARGFVTPQPHKRPKSSLIRFEADFPNERWQTDMTHVSLADGRVVEVLNVRSPDVVRTLHNAAAQWGYPASILADNGAIFTASAQGGIAAMETELLLLGITSKHSRPYHPQTCGKVERFHQTMKKFLAKQDPPVTTKQLQRQLDRFVKVYNTDRPHRALNRKTPLEAFEARERATPTGAIIDTAGYRVRRDKIDRAGLVSVRYRSRLHHIGVGRAYAGWRVIILIAGLDIQILGEDGSPLRRLTLDLTKNYQRQP